MYFLFLVLFKVENRVGETHKRILFGIKQALKQFFNNYETVTETRPNLNFQVQRIIKYFDNALHLKIEKYCTFKCVQPV
jgi:transposase